VAVGFTVEDEQGLREEVLKGGTLVHAMLSCPPRADAEELCSLLTSWTGVVTISIHIHQAEGKGVPGYNAWRDWVGICHSEGCREEVGHCKSTSDYRRWHRWVFHVSS